jgi:hypothetical protein
MVDYAKREKVALLRDFLNVVGTETEGVEVKITQDADNGMRFYADPEVLIDVKNDSGAQIDKGTPVYVSGTHGGSGKPTIEKAKADAAATMPAIGLTLTDLADEAEGYVVAAGTLRNLDTDTPAWDAGDALYVSPTTAGAMTTTRPTGDTELVQKVALVTRRHATAGSVIVMGAGRTNDTPNDSYSGRYDTEAETARSGATTTTEIYYTARPDGDGYAESEVDDGGLGAGEASRRRLYYSDKFDADPDTSGDWTLYTTQPADDTAFATCKASLLAGLSDTDGTANTRGTLPVSLKMERTVITPLLLDTYTGAQAAYSVRLLRTAYTGNALRIREGSGNTETDIGFDSNGDLDTAAIASHCGSANGYVVTWYDQSGNAYDVTQSTAADQPQIYNGTAVLTQNGKPAIDFDTEILVASSNLTSAQNTWLAVGASDTSTGDKILMGYFNFARMYWPHYVNGNGIWLSWFTFKTLQAQASQDTDQHLFAAYQDTSNKVARIDGAEVTLANTTNQTPNTPLGIGGLNGYAGYDWKGTVQEVVVYTANKYSDRSGIEYNINTYFSIYP